MIQPDGSRLSSQGAYENAGPVSAGRSTFPQSIPDAAFETVSSIAYNSFALNLDHTKKSMVYRRLAPHVKSLGMTNFEEYIALLEREETERDKLMSILTTNLTSFFRENHHFDMLRQDYLPALAKRAKDRGRVRLWSAACSSGQEPYSMAMTVLDTLPDAASMDLRILATDIDRNIINAARRGIYSAEKVADLPSALTQKYFRKISEPEESYEILHPVKALISFGQLNLVADWPFSGVFDVIFCRNVAIYFDQTTQQKLWQRLAERTKPGALLCIGHSERIAGPASKAFKSLGKTAYVRC